MFGGGDMPRYEIQGLLNHIAEESWSSPSRGGDRRRMAAPIKGVNQRRKLRKSQKLARRNNR